MSTDSAQPQAQTCDIVDSADDNSFRFTPIKAIRALPRIWERKPSTPFKAGLKPRKLWKRVQTSFSGMQPFQDTSSIIESDALQSAINSTKDSNFVRGTKRMRVGSDETESSARLPQSGRQFFETKWESEASRKRRKLPDSPFDIFDEKSESAPILDSFQKNQALGTDEKNVSASRHFQQPPSTSVFQDNALTPIPESLVSDTIVTTINEESKSVDEEQAGLRNDTSGEGNADAAPTPTKAVRALTQEQQGKLVRSALRSSLDGEDAELLNDFLSKAKAKRAAKATLVNSQGGEMDSLENSSSPEEPLNADCSTPRSRRALEDLDTNSPSPVKVQVSPLKGDVIPGDESQAIIIQKDVQTEEPAPASSTCRRSTRVKAPPANAPSGRNTISLRRAKGTEFVFLQRTEAQELALATKRNTRNNRGNSVMPKYALEAMMRPDQVSDATENDRQERSDRKGHSSRRPRKQVSWNEEHLAEYEDEVQPSDMQVEEVGDHSKHNVGGVASRARSGAKRSEKKIASSHRSSCSQVQQPATEQSADVESDPTTSTAAVSSATPRSRRVRRLGESTMTSGTPVKTGSGRIRKPSAASAPTVAAGGPSTPTKGPRRKLTPKSPSSSMLPTPAVKSTEQSFASGIPTRSTNSEAPQRKNMIEASAGCTPMPRRVRARS
ncbi:hypothetical protein N7532_008126 [Penicillium argentinense]|uniref:Uncharacterized protein n=1 Tax=Penicillium argentinense TaxID=1131581 RepID=A0A9W9EWU0_9EURO|nr:uncharacterized protein N7532_008126 [Penicillium argentinense]KAJ5089442.1 hypothetical protein N7532_008126 [Penicillium argentinense]